MALEALVCHIATPLSLQLERCMFLVMSLAQGCWFFEDCLQGVLTKATLGYPVTGPCLGDLAGIFPEDQPLHELQQVPDGVDARVSQPKAQLWAWILVSQVRSSSWGHSPRVW